MGSPHFFMSGPHLKKACRTRIGAGVASGAGYPVFLQL
jgi:hypothetical protein